MKQNGKSSRSRVSPDPDSLCQFPFADGRQCRMLRHPGHPSLCLFHAREEMQLLELDRLGEEIASLSAEFNTMTEVRRVVARLFKLVARNRIPLRNAQLLAYLAQLLLYSQKDVQHEITSAQGYRAWEQALRAAFPAPPRTSPRKAPSASVGAPSQEQAPT